MAKYYAIVRGRKNRYITNNYHECLSLVHGYSDAEFKSFGSWLEAALHLDYDLNPETDYSKYTKMKKGKANLVEPIRFFGKDSARV